MAGLELKESEIKKQMTFSSFNLLSIVICAGVFAGNIDLDEHADNLPRLSILQIGTNMNRMEYFASVDVTKPIGKV